MYRAAQRVSAPTIAGAALVLVACNPTELLQVTDPDIINVSDVSSALPISQQAVLLMR
ncbi:MAG: hypothetical protein NTW72_03575 [Gemmatimonadetes bacterium]|nr:hypothetical protein [Gemmatimonadota bacterium]